MNRLIVILLAWSGLALPTGAQDLPPEGGGGVDPHDFSDHMPAFVRANIERELAESAARLSAAGLLPPAGPRVPGNLLWPLRARAAHAFEGYHGISNFVDLNPAFPNQLLDYSCGTRTYDLTNGYNHSGIDFFLWPYPWRLMDQGRIEVVAAAAGVILAKHDGHDDRSCAGHSGANWNAVYLQHADGSVAWYGHLVRNSLTDKTVGQSVAAGEYLGLVGSSGFSSGPHLHLELRSSSLAGATIYEPFAGSCRAGASLWQSQRPYWDTALNGIAVHSAQPSKSVPCPNPTQEQPNFARIIQGGQTVFLSIYFRDEIVGADLTTLRLFRPDGTLWQQWTKAAPSQNFPASWWWWSRNIPNTAEHRGKWRYQVQFRSQTLTRHFWYGDVLFAEDFDEGQP